MRAASLSVTKRGVKWLVSLWDPDLHVEFILKKDKNVTVSWFRGPSKWKKKASREFYIEAGPAGGFGFKYVLKPFNLKVFTNRIQINSAELPFKYSSI
jgi:hypothetical protein